MRFAREILLGIGLVCLPTVSWAQGIPSGPYSGSFLARSTLSGDWAGWREELAKKGIVFHSTVTQAEQNVVAGGKDTGWEYGGRGDLIAEIDTQKLGLWPGGFLTAELEGNWNSSVNGETGALNPANMNQLFPLPIGNNVALPNLSYAQFLSHYVGALVGKLDTLSGDANEFADGKGDSQFMNLAFNINPTALVVPYSTLGTGVIVLPTADPKAALVKLMVLSAKGKASTSGFDEIEGAIFAGEGRVRTDFFGLTGHQLVGALYSNRAYTSVDQRLSFGVDDRGLERKRDTWAMYYNFDQFLLETDKEAGKGVGVFGRFGASAGNPNPAEYFFSIGFGGKGMLPSRDYDRFGIGYYYTKNNNPTFAVPLAGTRSFLRDEWGVEAFYNVAVTPWLMITPDVQILGPAQRTFAVGGLRNRKPVDTATVLGLRVQVVL